MTVPFSTSKDKAQVGLQLSKQQRAEIRGASSTPAPISPARRPSLPGAAPIRLAGQTLKVTCLPLPNKERAVGTGFSCPLVTTLEGMIQIHSS
jgi:hypothetical protein